MKLVVLAVVIATALGVAGCFQSPAVAPTPAPAKATVTDVSVPFDVSEADALTPRGFMGNGSLGRLGIGCALEVMKATDRAVQVKIISCPQSDDITNVPNGGKGLQGWVAKSALDIK